MEESTSKISLYCKHDDFTLYHGDMTAMLEVLNPNSIDSIVTDPPYELNFMDKGWDNSGIAFQKATWEKCYEVLKPGGYLLAFGGTRTFHRIACAIEDAGFEIRDTIMWIYGSGFPKSMNIGLAVDKKNGVESKVVGHSTNKIHLENLGNAGYKEEFDIKQAQNEWAGWGTSLKPAYEPVIVARKPCEGSCVENVLKYGVGGINIDDCRVGDEHFVIEDGDYDNNPNQSCFGNVKRTPKEYDGRFPSNVILTYDSTDEAEVCGGMPYTKSLASEYNFELADNNNPSRSVLTNHQGKKTKT
jgi:site-specific DNA-methyltransferase (adenine-specific)